jgi:hypothetical protein
MNLPISPHRQCGKKEIIMSDTSIERIEAEGAQTAAWAKADAFRQGHFVVVAMDPILPEFELFWADPSGNEDTTSPPEWVEVSVHRDSDGASITCTGRFNPQGQLRPGFATSAELSERTDFEILVQIETSPSFHDMICRALQAEYERQTRT